MTPQARRRERLAQTLAQSANLRAFLRVIRAGETSQDDEAYRTQVGGDLLDSLDDHPRDVVAVRIGGKTINSSAAGAYQFLRGTWDECAVALELTDFSPASQDVAAVFLIERRGALADVLAGRVREAIAKCAKEWASLPGSPYGQPTKTLEQALAVYREWGGTERPDDTPAPIGSRTIPKEQPMSPFVAAALPSLIDAIPKLGRLFSSGSKSAERNMAAAEAVIGIVQEATGATNVQQAAEMVQRDPVARQAATEAVERRWMELTEAGGGGIAGAREAVKTAPVPSKNPVLWVSAALLPLVYLVVYAVLFREGWSDEVRAMVVAAVVTGALGAVTSYWLGTSISSAKKDDALIGR